MESKLKGCKEMQEQNTLLIRIFEIRLHANGFCAWIVILGEGLIYQDIVPDEVYLKLFLA